MVAVPQLSLTLFVARIGADDQQFAVPPHQLAVFADPFNARSYFHDRTPAESRHFGKSFL
jgi:hypothetical protein